MAACVSIRDWSDAEPASQCQLTIDDVAEYEPGQFYRRELPCLSAILATLPRRPAVVVIDGYVDLDDRHRPGLGRHLHESLDRAVPVIGVAKNPYRQTKHAAEVRRGSSDRPLFETAAGTPIDRAAGHIAVMHGRHRIPTILKTVDRLSRRFDSSASMEPDRHDDRGVE